MASRRLARPDEQTSHEIVDASGQRRGFYGNKSAASRGLNRARGDYNRPDAIRFVGADDTPELADPNTWTIRPVTPTLED